MLALSTRPVQCAQGPCFSRARHKKSKRVVDEIMGMIAGNSLSNLPVDPNKQLQPYNNWLENKFKTQSLFLKAGEGNIKAQHELLSYFTDTDGYNPQDVLDNFHGAVFRNDPKLNLVLGKILLLGPKPHHGIIRLILAAGMNDPEAHKLLGKCYEEGISVTKNPKKALEHYKKAYDLGLVDAADNISRLTGLNSSKE